MAEVLSGAPGVAVEIGGVPILLRTRHTQFRQMLQERYAGFITNSGQAGFAFDVDVRDAPSDIPSDEDIDVRMQAGRWVLRRGDFRAEFDPQTASGLIQQSANPYSIDSVLRIMHTLILAKRGGFLLHAASAVRNGRAYLFAGISGAGKTTISRLAPPDATLLSDEVSYVRKSTTGYVVCGTPFAGELGKAGENTSAPLTTLFFLRKGPGNQIEELDSQDAVRRLLRNVLFFADDSQLVALVFQAACDVVDRVPVRQLTFTPDERVWEMIR